MVLYIPLLLLSDNYSGVYVLQFRNKLTNEFLGNHRQILLSK